MENDTMHTTSNQPPENQLPPSQPPIIPPSIPPKKKRWLPIVITIIILAAIAAAAWYIIQSQSANQQATLNDDTVTISGETSDEEKATDTSSSLATAAASAPACGYTTATTEGPYYISNTKELTNGNLNYDNLPGDPIKIGGYVYESETNTNPVANAKIEIWHADSSGNYHPNANGSAANFKEDELSLRGYVVADENGYYEFTSIFPGEYEGRARHIHVRVTSDGYTGITSQIITSLSTDKVQASQDSIAQSLDLSCAQPTLTTVDGVQEGVYNFHIQAS